MAEKSIMKGDSKYLWRRCNENDMILWPRGSTQRYITKASELVPGEFLGVGDVGDIAEPPNFSVDILGRRGIRAAGFSVKTSRSYHYIGKTAYTVVIFATRGELALDSFGKKMRAKTGDMLVVPSGSACELRVRGSRAEIIWLHIDGAHPLGSRFGSDAFVRPAKNFREILSVMEMYRAEIYSKTRSAALLENLADILVEYLRREFPHSPKAITPDAIRGIIDKVRANPKGKWTLASTARRLKVPVHVFDAACADVCGEKFSKVVLQIRMRTAMLILKGGRTTCARAAEDVGYKNAFSFSRAFTRYYGSPPSAFNAKP